MFSRLFLQREDTDSFGGGLWHRRRPDGGERHRRGRPKRSGDRLLLRGGHQRAAPAQRLRLLAPSRALQPRYRRFSFAVHRWRSSAHQYSWLARACPRVLLQRRPGTQPKRDRSR